MVLVILEITDMLSFKKYFTNIALDREETRELKLRDFYLFFPLLYLFPPYKREVGRKERRDIVIS